MRMNVATESVKSPAQKSPAQKAGALSAGGALRIAVITETWPPEVNGVAMSIARVVEGLLERQHDVQLIRPRQRMAKGQKQALAEHAGLEEILSPSLPIPGYSSLRMGLAFGLRLKRRWLQEPPDVVHLATEGPLGERGAHRLEVVLPAELDSGGDVGDGGTQGVVGGRMARRHGDVKEGDPRRANTSAAEVRGPIPEPGGAVMRAEQRGPGRWMRGERTTGGHNRSDA